MHHELSASGERSLRSIFAELVWRRFFEGVHLEEPQVATYVAALLADFTRMENLYRIRNAHGQQLQDVGEMLIESNPLLEAASFDREREVRKHVGDYTLFMTGFFPEGVASNCQRHEPQIDTLLDFVQAGKESYAIVSSFNQLSPDHQLLSTISGDIWPMNRYVSLLRNDCPSASRRPLQALGREWLEAFPPQMSRNVGPIE
jgi:hypothetical protein